MYLAIDLGDKRCGIATEQAGIVFPQEIVLRPKLLSTIKKYILNHKVHTIVVGLPYDLYGKYDKQLKKTKQYIDYLKQEFPDITIEGCDERFSSFAADQVSSELGDQEKRDDIAAALILETYLDQKK